MLATVMYSAGDVRVVQVPNAGRAHRRDRACHAGLQADGTLYPLRRKIDASQWASLMSLSDLMGTGHHAAVTARVGPGRTAAVVGDGAVGLCGVIEAKRLGAERIMALTGGQGVHSVLECVGSGDAIVDAVAIARPGGAIGRVGVPHYEGIPAGPTFFENLFVGGGPAPARAYINELLPDVLEGRIRPGRVFDRTMSLRDTPEGYRAMDSREAIKVLIEP